jgi:tripartite-type tricarboxylate transporter receptor subunit TctC
MTTLSTSRRMLLQAAMAGAFPASWNALAQSSDMPRPALSKARFVVGFGAGGVPDAAARAIAAQLTEQWKIPAMVENKLGAGGTLAAQTVLNAPPDGTTILSVSPAHATAPAIFRSMPYDTLRDFAPVTLIGDGPALVIAPADSPFMNLRELVAHAKANPGKLNYASAGVGSSSHFASELLCMEAGMDVVNIPYKSIGEAITEVLAGRVSFHVAPYLSAIKQVEAGKVRALAVTGKTRLAALPDVPTPAESGVSGYEWSFWYGLLVSAKTPAALVSQLHKDLTAIINQPAVRTQLTGMGVAISAGTPEQFKSLIEAEVAKYARIAKAANIQPS